jgi:hypothetical protein
MGMVPCVRLCDCRRKERGEVAERGSSCVWICEWKELALGQRGDREKIDVN